MSNKRYRQKPKDDRSTFKIFATPPGVSWFDGTINHIDNGGLPPGFRGASIYSDANFLKACDEAGMPAFDLFQKFSDHGEPGIEDKWMWEMMLQPGAGLMPAYAVHPKNVKRFNQFITTVILSAGGAFPPLSPAVLPRVAMVNPAADDSNPQWVRDIARSPYRERFVVIDGKVVQPDDPLWVDLAIKWPGMGTRRTNDD
jgi:hypothetical protein